MHEQWQPTDNSKDNYCTGVPIDSNSTTITGLLLRNSFETTKETHDLPYTYVMVT